MNVITNKFVGLKCLTETKIQILYDHVDHTRFQIVEMGRQIVQLLSACNNVRQFDPSLRAKHAVSTSQIVLGNVVWSLFKKCPHLRSMALLNVN